LDLIKVYPNAVCNLSTNVIRYSTRVYEIRNGLTTTRGNIDGKILARRNIGGRISSEISSLMKVEKNLRDFYTFVTNSMDLYESTENKLVKQAKE
jgi:hypothetical protein